METENNEELKNPIEPEKDWQAIAISLAKELEGKREIEKKEKKLEEDWEKLKDPTNPFKITPEMEKFAEEQGVYKPAEKSKSISDPKWYKQKTEKESEIINQNIKERGYQI